MTRWNTAILGGVILGILTLSGRLFIPAVPTGVIEGYVVDAGAGSPVVGAHATVTVVQNGVTEVYGPYTVPAGGFCPSWGWPDWWENTPDPIFGLFTGPGGPVVY
ncbi:MAG: hypothetical protein NUV94_02565 [Candidatus Acetothermia bacterium]|jgi:hypothetical protein|nr:hypothetical protein [Candidatus Acetothermia bacterium]